MLLHAFLDSNHGTDRGEVLRRRLAGGVDSGSRAGPLAETPLHVAASLAVRALLPDTLPEDRS